MPFWHYVYSRSFIFLGIHFLRDIVIIKCNNYGTIFSVLRWAAILAANDCTPCASRRCLWVFAAIWVRRVFWTVGSAEVFVRQSEKQKRRWRRRPDDTKWRKPEPPYQVEEKKERIYEEKVCIWQILNKWHIQTNMNSYPPLGCRHIQIEIRYAYDRY